MRVAGLGALALIAAATPAQASDWYFIDMADNGANVSFVDKDSIQTNGDGNLVASIFSLLAAPDSEGSLAFRFTVEFDCAKQRSRFLMVEPFDTDRKSDGELADPGDWKATAPDTQGSRFAGFVCSKGSSGAREASAGSELPFDRGQALLAAHKSG